MAREIKGTIYKLCYTATWHFFVECSNEEDLFRYIAQEACAGRIISSVTEICKNGTTPKVKVFKSKEYQRIYKEVKRLSTIELKKENEK